jgi:LacI family transcriptional regulator
VATIKDIAHRAGVSIAVVSYVINNGPRSVAPETETRVREVMEALDYHPNVRAQQLARQRSNCIGLIFNGLSDASFNGLYFSEYSRGILSHAGKTGYNVMLFLNQGSDFYKRVGKMGLVDGVILAGSALPAAELTKLVNPDFPAVVIGQHIPGFAWVAQDDEGAAYTATAYLLAQGYCRIGLIGQALSLSYGQDRLNGYRRALSEAGIAFDPQLVSVPPAARDIPTSDEIQKLVQAGCDALLTDKEPSVMEHLRGLNLRVPDHIGLIGLDEDTAESRSLNVTTLLAPKFEIGVMAAEILWNLVCASPDTAKYQTVPMQLIVRGSSPRRERS